MRMPMSKPSALTVATLLAGLLSACASSPGPDARRTAPQASVAAAPEAEPSRGAVAPDGPVVLGLLVPTTSEQESAAVLAGAMVNAARMAEEDLADPQLSVAVFDTAGNPATAAAVASRAVAEGADLLLGPLFSTSTEQAGAAVSASGVKVLSFSNDSAVAGGPIFVTGYTPESEARRIVSYATAQGLLSHAIFYPDTVYGIAALRGAQQEAGSFVASASYERSFEGIETASGPFAASALAAGASSVLLPAGGQELTAAAGFLNFAGLDPAVVKYLGTGKWKARATFDEAALRGGWFPAAEPSREQAFAERYGARFGSTPPPLAYLAYDGVKIAGRLLADARAAGLSDAFSRTALLRPDGFIGAIGPIRFNQNQVAERAMAILEVGPGRFQTREPAPVGFTSTGS